LNPVLKYIDSFIALFYPRICLTCDAVLNLNEELLCTSCRILLPETGYHLKGNNPVEELLTGRLKVEKALSLLFFDKGSRYKKIIHHLKYKGRKEAGIFLGQMLGSRIDICDMPPIDLIVPIPLHPAKLRRRGYNQSAIIAYGIADILDKPVDEKTLQRVKYTSTQTRIGRYARWQNVEGMFRCTNPSSIEGKHILLVDDVVTTGSTLEAAGSTLLLTKNVKISVATAAYAAK
jgi:ComF family protein